MNIVNNIFRYDLEDYKHDVYFKVLRIIYYQDRFQLERLDRLIYYRSSDFALKEIRECYKLCKTINIAMFYVVLPLFLFMLYKIIAGMSTSQFSFISSQELLIIGCYFIVIVALFLWYTHKYTSAEQNLISDILDAIYDDI